MGCCASESVRVANVPKPMPLPGGPGKAGFWSKDKAEKLQEAVDRVFGSGGLDGFMGLSLSAGEQVPQGLQFSFTVADPLSTECPIVGCSTGFCALTGYTMREVLGHNCRFLLDPVKPHLIDTAMRKHAKEFCMAVREGKPYWVPEAGREDWMPNRPGDELFCVQRNARKSGTLFHNMFYLKVVHLGGDLGKERPYIFGLQSELPSGKDDLAMICKNLSHLDSNMEEVVASMASFLVTGCFKRQ